MADFDVVITTALIPGRPAPKLIPASAVAAMRPGSVIVDLAAEAGGNCELTAPGEEVVRDDVTIVGFTDLPSRMAFHASQLYSRNVHALLTHLAPEANARSSTSRTRSSAAPASPGRRRHRESRHAARLRADDPRARDLPRLRGDLEGADAAAHAADVGHERDPRDRHRRRDARRGNGHRRTRYARSSASSRSSSPRRTSSAASSSPTGCSRCSRSASRRSRTTPLEHRTSANLLYLVTIVTFILALKFLSSPATARRGNQIGAIGMAARDRGHASRRRTIVQLLVDRRSAS